MTSQSGLLPSELKSNYCKVVGVLFPVTDPVIEGDHPLAPSAECVGRRVV